jgi:hypothetical protein
LGEELCAHHLDTFANFGSFGSKKLCNEQQDLESRVGYLKNGIRINVDKAVMN